MNKREYHCPVCRKIRGEQNPIETFRQGAIVEGANGEDTMIQVTGWRCPVCKAEGVFAKEAPQQGPRCDFCGDEDPLCIFPCADFIYDNFTYRGGWAACGVCRLLVLAEDREGLLSRAIHENARRNPRRVEAMLARGKMPGADARALQRLFFEHQIKEPNQPGPPTGTKRAEHG